MAVDGIRFCVLASGSSGNACYVETENSRILIDAGLSCRELVRRLDLMGADPERVDALVVTHEHSDHLKGAGPLTRRFDIPLYTNRKTLAKGLKTLGSIARPVIVQTGQTFTIRDLTVETFTKCHDAADPFGLVLSYNGLRIGLLTDLGRSTRLVEDRLKGCQALIIEFNHDPAMLDDGPYPLDLKRRIKGQEGHLSNQEAGDLLSAVSHPDLKCVVLAHLSETNNEPDRARHEATKALEKRGLSTTKILIGRQNDPGPMFEL